MVNTLPDDQLDPFVVSPRHAHQKFGLDQERFTEIPKQKFLFYVKFLVKSDIDTIWDENDVSFIVKSVDKPTINFSTQTLNQYNRKRVIYTNIEYQTINMEFIDTVDDRLIKMLKEYSKFYFGDFKFHGTANNRWQKDQMFENFDTNSPGNEYRWGFSPPRGRTVSESDFFERAQIYQIFGNRFTRYDIINPKINQFNPDNEDKEDENKNTMAISFDYEGLVIKSIHEELTDDLRDELMGWADDRILDVPGRDGNVADRGNTPEGNNSTENTVTDVTESSVTDGLTQNPPTPQTFNSNELASARPPRNVSEFATREQQNPLTPQTFNSNELASARPPRNVPEFATREQQNPQPVDGNSDINTDGEGNRVTTIQENTIV